MNKNVDSFTNFMNGFTAAVQLLHRSGQNGFFIEYICLSASVIDGLLRMGLILLHQLETKSKDILETLLYQSDEDKVVSEKKYIKWHCRKILFHKIYMSN